MKRLDVPYNLKRFVRWFYWSNKRIDCCFFFTFWSKVEERKKKNVPRTRIQQIRCQLDLCGFVIKLVHSNRIARRNRYSDFIFSNILPTLGLTRMREPTYEECVNLLVVLFFFFKGVRTFNVNTL